jgi:AcrR family transcriptional regulator
MASDPARVVARARDRLLAGAPLDISAIAAECGVSRVTVHRWFGSRDGLLAEALWSVTADLLSGVRADGGATGAARVLEAAERYVRAMAGLGPVLALVRHDPRGAARALADPEGGIQDRLVEAVAEVVRGEQRAGRYRPALEPGVLARLIVQTGLDLTWTAALLDRPADPGPALDLLRAVVELERPPPASGGV